MRDLLVLQDHYRGLYDSAHLWFEHAERLRIRVSLALATRDVLQDRQNYIAGKVRRAELHWYNVAISNPHMADYREKYGKDTSQMIWDDVRLRLAKLPEYVGWLVELGGLQRELETYPGAIEQLKRQMNMVKAQAARLALNAGAIRKEIQDA